MALSLAGRESFLRFKAGVPEAEAELLRCYHVIQDSEHPCIAGNNMKQCNSGHYFNIQQSFLTCEAISHAIDR
jgi:hypothetical protein